MSNYAKRQYDRITDIRDSEKISLLFKVIPQDVHTVIDIGCGNGILTNELEVKYEILGVDINESKLAFVRTPKIQASCDKVPVGDQSFDLVFSSEMIEHLETDLMLRSFQELARISRKYILITVPNREPLYKLEVKCESCKKLYHKNGHLHRFTASTLPDYFPGWEVIDLRTFGKKVRGYSKPLAELKHRYSPPDAWIPAHWVRTQGVPFHFCTHCGYKNTTTPRFHPVAFAADTLNIFISSKNPGHLMVLLRKSG